MASPTGVKGFVKIRTLSGELDHLLTLEEVQLRQNSREKTYIIEESREVNAVVLMKFRGIDSPEDAKTLNGAELLVDRAAAAPLDAGEYYIEDLKGIKVVLGSFDGTELGEIIDIMDGGGSDLVEISLLSGERRLVPFRNEFFGDISLEKQKAVLLNTWILE